MAHNRERRVESSPFASLVFARLVRLGAAALPPTGDTPSMRDSTYRVFLKSGEALPSYGEAAR